MNGDGRCEQGQRHADRNAVPSGSGYSQPRMAQAVPSSHSPSAVASRGAACVATTKIKPQNAPMNPANVTTRSASRRHSSHKGAAYMASAAPAIATVTLAVCRYMPAVAITAAPVTHPAEAHHISSVSRCVPDPVSQRTTKPAIRKQIATQASMPNRPPLATDSQCWLIEIPLPARTKIAPTAASDSVASERRRLSRWSPARPSGPAPNLRRNQSQYSNGGGCRYNDREHNRDKRQHGEPTSDQGVPGLRRNRRSSLSCRDVASATSPSHRAVTGRAGPKAPLTGDLRPLFAAELRLHQGTIWRWNRAIYDPASGGLAWPVHTWPAD